MPVLPGSARGRVASLRVAYVHLVAVPGVCGDGRADGRRRSGGALVWAHIVTGEDARQQLFPTFVPALQAARRVRVLRESGRELWVSAPFRPADPPRGYPPLLYAHLLVVWPSAEPTRSTCGYLARDGWLEPRTRAYRQALEGRRLCVICGRYAWIEPDAAGTTAAELAAVHAAGLRRANRNNNPDRRRETRLEIRAAAIADGSFRAIAAGDWPADAPLPDAAEAGWEPPPAVAVARRRLAARR